MSSRENLLLKWFYKKNKTKQKNLGLEMRNSIAIVFFTIPVLLFLFLKSNFCLNRVSTLVLTFFLLTLSHWNCSLYLMHTLKNLLTKPKLTLPQQIHVLLLPLLNKWMSSVKMHLALETRSQKLMRSHSCPGKISPCALVLPILTRVSSVISQHLGVVSPD